MFWNLMNGHDGFPGDCGEQRPFVAFLLYNVRNNNGEEMLGAKYIADRIASKMWGGV